MTLIDRELLSKIFNDTKRRTVSLQQQSYLFSLVVSSVPVQTCCLKMILIRILAVVVVSQRDVAQ